MCFALNVIMFILKYNLDSRKPYVYSPSISDVITSCLPTPESGKSGIYSSGTNTMVHKNVDRANYITNCQYVDCKYKLKKHVSNTFGGVMRPFGC